MIALRAVGLTLMMVLLLACVTPSAQSAPSRKQQVQNALTEFRSGLRHADGETACGRMTLRYRKTVLGAFADEGIAGLGCVSIIEIYGRDLYNEIKNRARRVQSVRFPTRTRAIARTNTGGWMCFRRVESNYWQISAASPSRACKP